MRKIISILILSLMVFSLVGCGGNQDVAVKLGDTTSIGDFKVTIVTVNKGNTRITTCNNDFWLPIEDKPTYFSDGYEFRNTGAIAPAGKQYVVATVELSYEGKTDKEILFNNSFELLYGDGYSFKPEEAHITTGERISLNVMGIKWEKVAYSGGGKYYSFETMNDQIYTLRVCFEVPERVVDENGDLTLTITMDGKSQTFNLQ